MPTDHTSQLDQIYDDVISDLGGPLVTEQMKQLNKYETAFWLLVSELGPLRATLSYGLRRLLMELQIAPRPRDADQ